jgi:hypothetical protein
VTEAHEQFSDFYERHRLRDQLRYYQQRRNEFEVAQLQGTWLAGVIMLLASASALLGASAAGPFPTAWRMLAAALPALSATVVAFQRLFGFERLAKLYEDAASALGAVAHRPTGETDAEVNLAIHAQVAQVERILLQEQGQWGQLAVELHAPAAENDLGRGGAGGDGARVSDGSARHAPPSGPG